MTAPDHNSEIRGCGNDVAAYALGALDAAEVEVFRAHLETCAVCRDELAAFQNVVETLPSSVPQHAAPSALRRRVLDAVEQESRLELPKRRRRQARSPFAGFSIPRPALALGASLAIAAAVVVGVEVNGSTARVYEARVTGPGSAEITVSGGHAELVVRHFAPPPPGKIYEVWLARSGQSPTPTSALFSVTASGDGDVDVPGDLQGVNEVLVTPEPDGGSRVPTHSPVISVQLS
jgi:anti-sigma-K factor RskA